MSRTVQDTADGYEDDLSASDLRTVYAETVRELEDRYGAELDAPELDFARNGPAFSNDVPMVAGMRYDPEGHRFVLPEHKIGRSRRDMFGAEMRAALQQLAGRYVGEAAAIDRDLTVGGGETWRYDRSRDQLRLPGMALRHVDLRTGTVPDGWIDAVETVAEKLDA